MSNRLVQQVLAYGLGLSLCGAASAGMDGMKGDGIKGIAFPNQFLSEVAGAHDLGTGPVHGIDLNLRLGSASAFGAVRNEPGRSRTFLNGMGLESAFGADADDFGLVDYQSKTKFKRVNGGYEFRLQQLLSQQRVNGEMPSLATGGGVWAQYLFSDPTRDPSAMLDLKVNFHFQGRFSIDKARPVDVFSLNLQYGFSDADSGATLRAGTGAFQGSTISQFALGLFDTPDFTRTVTDAGSRFDIDLAGDLEIELSLRNGTRFDASLVSFTALSGAPSGSGLFTFDSRDTLGFALEPAAGFESAQLTLVPKPASVLLMMVGLLFVAGATRMRARLD